MMRVRHIFTESFTLIRVPYDKKHLANTKNSRYQFGIWPDQSLLQTIWSKFQERSAEHMYSKD